MSELLQLRDQPASVRFVVASLVPVGTEVVGGPIAFQHPVRRDQDRVRDRDLGPAQAYNATIKATPLSPGPRRASPGSAAHHAVHRLGKISLRRAGRMHHVGVGAAHAGSAVTILIDADTVTVIHRDTGEVLKEHTIDPSRSYWRNQQQPPGRWPHDMNDDSTQIWTMSRLITARGA